MATMHNNFTISILSLGVFLFFFFASTSFANSTIIFLEDTFFQEKVPAVIGETALVVFVADTQSKRDKGLSGRKKLGLFEGMYFIFHKDGRYGIWMKDMKFPIDIIWLDRNHEVVHIEKNISPETFPKVFTPSKPARYVLEVKSGFSDRHFLKKGDVFTSL